MYVVFLLKVQNWTQVIIHFDEICFINTFVVLIFSTSCGVIETVIDYQNFQNVRLIYRIYNTIKKRLRETSKRSLKHKSWNRNMKNLRI